MRPWLADHRAEVFLATKTGERQGADARAELERSLTRMDVDQVDLIQLHNLVEPDEWDVAFGPERCGRGPRRGTRRGARALHRRHRPWVADRRDAPSQPRPVRLRLGAAALQLLVAPDRGLPPTSSIKCSSSAPNVTVAVQTIKAIARRRWQEEPEPRFSWYEPLTDPDAIDRAVRYVLADQQLFLNTTSDARLVPAHRRGRRGERSLARPTTSCWPTARRSGSHRCSTVPSSSESDRRRSHEREVDRHGVARIRDAIPAERGVGTVEARGSRRRRRPTS